ncbi:MAG: hypothetical protein WBN92_08755, partial [Terriglobia bacterium]
MKGFVRVQIHLKQGQSCEVSYQIVDLWMYRKAIEERQINQKSRLLAPCSEYVCECRQEQAIFGETNRSDLSFQCLPEGGFEAALS